MKAITLSLALSIPLFGVLALLLGGSISGEVGPMQMKSESPPAEQLK